MSDFKRIKTIKSHSGYARFLAELDSDDEEYLIAVAYIARCQREEIPAPYAYSPADALYRWNGKKVLVSEVSHRRYEVFEVAPQLKTFITDEAATEYHIRMTRKAA